MKPIDSSRCKIQVLVCTNERTNGKVNCKAVGGYNFYLRLKDKIEAEGLRDTHWVSRTGCLGFCNTEGTTLAIHPKGGASLWIHEVTDQDFDKIWKLITQ